MDEAILKFGTQQIKDKIEESKQRSLLDPNHKENCWNKIVASRNKLKDKKIEAKNNPKKDKSIPRGANRNSPKEIVMRTEKMDHSLNQEPPKSKYPSRNRKKPSKFEDFSPIDSLIEDCDEPSNNVVTTLKPSNSRSSSRDNAQEVIIRRRSSRIITSATAPSPETSTRRRPSRIVTSGTAPSSETSTRRRSSRIVTSGTAPSPEIITLRRSLRITNNNVVNVPSRESPSHTSYSLRNNRRRASKKYDDYL